MYTGALVWGTNGKGKDEPVRVEKAFPSIVSKSRFRRVIRLMRSRAPKVAHPRRMGSTYLLSGLVKCKACNRALSGQDAKSGQFYYYVCQSIMKRGKDACETPRLNARRFKGLVVGKIRSNVLTDSNIRALVKVVDEQMDSVVAEQRKRLETIEEELEDVKRILGLMGLNCEPFGTQSQYIPYIRKRWASWVKEEFHNSPDCSSQGSLWPTNLSPADGYSWPFRETHR